jgi:thymidylate synthase
VNANGTRLAGITRDLWNEWQRTRNSWRDDKSREFEQKFLAELLSSVDKTVGVIEQMDKLITKIRKDCE